MKKIFCHGQWKVEYDHDLLWKLNVLVFRRKL
jgi:hypothetical protein